MMMTDFSSNQFDACGFVQGSIFINPYYELKMATAQVYIVKHILAGGRRVASVYEKVTSWNRQGLGCSTIVDNLGYASANAIMIWMLIVFMGYFFNYALSVWVLVESEERLLTCKRFLGWYDLSGCALIVSGFYF